MTRCLVCHGSFVPDWTLGTLFRRAWVCERCRLTHLEVEAGCRTCGHPCPSGAPYCRDCVRWEALGVPLDVRCLYEYDEAGAAWLHRFKFFGDVRLLEQVRPLLRTQRTKGCVYVPVPLGPERLNSRRFNQAELIARAIGPVRDLLAKVDTPSQRERTRLQRRERLNPFAVQASPPCAKIVLVDDVYTTGTTLRQAAFSLRRAGFEPVGAICLFRAVKK